MTGITAMVMAMILGIMGMDYGMPTQKITYIDEGKPEGDHITYHVEEALYNRHWTEIGYIEYDICKPID